MGVIRGCTSRNMRSFGSPHMDKGRLNAFLKKSSVKKKSWGNFESEKNAGIDIDRGINMTLSFKRTFLNPLAPNDIYTGSFKKI